MSYTYNKTIIIGRLGENPELKEGKKIEYVTFMLSNSTFQNGQEIVLWHKIAAFGKQARVICQNLQKGDLCCIEGRLESEYYKAENGEDKAKQIIVAERVTFLSSKRKREEPAESETSEICEVTPA